MAKKDKSIIGQKLTDIESKQFFDYAEKHTLEDGISYLLKKHSIELGTSALSRWLTKRREEEKMIAFQRLLSDLGFFKARAEEVEAKLGSLDVLSEANLGLLAQSYMNAQISGDPNAMRQFGEQFTYLLDAMAKMRRANAAVQDSETSRQKFQFDAAKAAMEKAEKLVEIKRSSGTEKEKIQRAIDVTFGAPPEPGAAS